MFVCSMRASTLKFFGVMALAVVTLLALMVFVPQYEAAGAESELRFSGIRTGEDRVSFLASLGYTVAPEALECEEFTLPEEFDRALAAYNEMQKPMGLDLSRYAKKTVTRYTYRVTDYAGYTGEVYANLIVYRDTVIAGDICSADPSGFVHALERAA